MTKGEPTDEELCRLVRGDGDRNPVDLSPEQAADLLVRRHTPMVVDLARKTGYTGADMDDLIQEGLIGLSYAAKKWTPGHGSNSKFTTYANVVVRNQINSQIEKFKRRENERCESDRGQDLSGFATEPLAGVDISEVLARLTPLERGLVSLLWGLEGTPVKIAAAGKRFGLTVRQAQEIVESAFLRLRKWSRDQSAVGQSWD